MIKSLAISSLALAISAGGGPAQAAPLPSTSATTTYHTVAVGDVRVFYREAGPPEAPTLLLLHGYPSSSRQFDGLIPLLADRYHVVAPDYPGFGQSDAPPAEEFHYTFDHLAEVIGAFTEALQLTSYVLYLNDYGGPVGFRLALAHPEPVKAFVIQNAVSHEEGLGPAWEVRKASWKDRAAFEDKVITGFVSLEGCKARHVGNSPIRSATIRTPGRTSTPCCRGRASDRIQSDLFYDYQTNVASYPKWQAWMREYKPPMLVVWGRYAPSFTVDGASAYKRDVPDAEVHFWTLAISRWMKGSTRSPHSCETFSRRTIFRRGRDAAAVRGSVSSSAPYRWSFGGLERRCRSVKSCRAARGEAIYCITSTAEQLSASNVVQVMLCK